MKFESFADVKDKVFRVFPRPEFVEDDPTYEDDHPLTMLAYTLERDLYITELHYQGIEVKDDDIPYL